MHNGIHHQSSLREKLKSSMCCFTGMVHHDPLDHGCNYNKLDINTPRTPRSPTTPVSPSGTLSWLKKSPLSSEYGQGEPPRVRGRSLRDRIRRHHHHHHHHHHRTSQSADFSYDPSSYALNFENEGPEEYPLRNFSSRLPASPPTTSSGLKYSDELAVSSVPKEIVGYS